MLIPSRKVWIQQFSFQQWVKIVEQTELFNFGMEKEDRIQTSFTRCNFFFPHIKVCVIEYFYISGTFLPDNYSPAI